MIKEAAMWPKIREVFMKNKGHVERFENSISFGAPDIYCCLNGQSFWIESKKEIGNIVTFRATQLVWLYKHTIAEGHAFILTINDNKQVFSYSASEIIKRKLSLLDNCAPLSMSLKVDLTGLPIIYPVKFSVSYDWEQLMYKLYNRTL